MTNIKELMTASGDTAPCNRDIYKNGVQVAVLHGASARLIERFVREVAEYSEQPVDWHYVGGRARVLTTGDCERVRLAITALSIHCKVM